MSADWDQEHFPECDEDDSCRCHEMRIEELEQQLWTLRVAARELAAWTAGFGGGRASQAREKILALVDESPPAPKYPAVSRWGLSGNLIIKPDGEA